MKRFLFFLLILLLPLSSCQKRPTANTLLSYEGKPYEMLLQIPDFPILAVKNGEKFTVTILEGPLQGIVFSYDGDGNIIGQKEDFAISLPTSGGAISDLHTLFHLTDGHFLWKIEEKTVNDRSVYQLQTDDITVYIEKNTGMPICMEKGNLHMDIKKSQP